MSKYDSERILFELQPTRSTKQAHWCKSPKVSSGFSSFENETAPSPLLLPFQTDLQTMPKSHTYEITQASPNEEEEEEEGKEEDAFVGRSALFVGRGRKYVHG